MKCNVKNLNKVLDLIGVSKHITTENLTVASGERFRGFITGIIDIADKAGEATQELSSYSKINMYKSANDLIENLTGGSHKTIESFLSTATEENIIQVSRLANHYFESLIGLMKDPRAVYEQSQKNTDALKMLKFHVITRERALSNKLSWNPLSWLTSPNIVLGKGDKRFEYLIHRDPMFRMFKPANDTKIEAEYIANGASKYAELGRRYVEDIVTKNSDTEVTAQMINTLIKFMDPTKSMPNLTAGIKRSVIDIAIKDRIENVMKSEFATMIESKDDPKAYIDLVFNRLKKVQAEYNVYNYGVKDPYSFNDTTGMTWNPITKKQILEQGNPVIYEGTAYPSFLKMWLHTGQDLFKMTNDMDVNTRHDVKIDEMRELFNPDNTNDEGFRLRMNYFPTAKTDDMFGDEHFQRVANSTGTVLGVNANMFSSRQKLYDTNDTTTLTSLTANSLKSFKFYANVMSDYSMSLKIKDQLMRNQSVVKSNNPELYDALSYYVNRKIDNYNTKEDDKIISPSSQAFKQMVYSAIGFTVAARLTTSALTNRLGGYFTSMSKLKGKEKSEMKDDWKTFHSTSGIYKRIIDTIEDSEEHYAVKDKISDVVRQENFKTLDTANKEVFKNFPEVMNRVSTNLDMYSDRLMNSFLGIMPKAWKEIAFSGSENSMLSFTSKFMFHDLKLIADQQMKVWGVDESNIKSEQQDELMRILNDHSDRHKAFYYNTIKEMVGSYTQSSKPLYQTDYMKNAKSKTAIVVGGAMLMHGIFKQISANNNEVINRMYAGYSSFDVNPLGKNPYSKGAYAPSGAFGIVLLGLYNFILDEEEEDKKQLNLMQRFPRAYALNTVNVFGEKQMTYNAVKAAIKINMGLNATDRDYKNLEQAGKFMIGIPAGRGSSVYEGYVNKGEYESVKNIYKNTGDLVQRFLGYDPGYQQVKAIFDGIGADDLTPKQRKSAIKTGMSKGWFVFDNNNDIVKAATDVMILAREFTELPGSKNDRADLLKMGDYAWESLKNTIGINYYIPLTDMGFEDHNDIQFNRWNRYEHINAASEAYTRKGNYTKANELKNLSYEAKKLFSRAQRGLKTKNYELQRITNEINYNRGR